MWPEASRMIEALPFVPQETVLNSPRASTPAGPSLSALLDSPRLKARPRAAPIIAPAARSAAATRRDRNRPLTRPQHTPLVESRFSADREAVEPAESMWRPLGELLLEKGLVSPDELELALGEQAESGRLLGAILVERGYVSGPALAVALAEQYGVELPTERGFGTGLWAEIDRRHRGGRRPN